MDYRIVGVYDEHKDATFNNTELYLKDGKKYEIEYFPIYGHYEIKGNTIVLEGVTFPIKHNYQKILLTAKSLFICYNKKLEVYDRKGDLIKEIESKKKIIIGDGGFVVFDDISYLFNLSGNSIFIEVDENTIEFTPNATTISLSRAVDSLNKVDEKRHLMINAYGVTYEYDEDGEILFDFEEYQILHRKARITDVVKVKSINLEFINSNPEKENSECILVLTKKYFFVIIKDFVVKQILKSEFIDIIPERLIIHDYIHECSFYSCFLALSCFVNIKLYKMAEIEEFLRTLINTGQDKELVKRFISCLTANKESTKNEPINLQKIICRVYRQVDDDSKIFLDQYIDMESLDADSMYYIIIYKPMYVPKFIRMCKEQKRLFYLEELRGFYEKTDRIEECKRLFLENGLLIFDYEGVELLNELEKKQIESQRQCFLAKRYP